MNSRLEEYKILRFIKNQGSMYLFTKYKKDQFGEPIDEVEKLVKIEGVYHEVQGYVSKNSSDAGTVKTKPSSFILCLWDEAIDLEPGMRVNIKGDEYVVVDRRNIEKFSLACDISLELVLK